MSKWKVYRFNVEFKKEDLWIGAFWHKSPRIFEVWLCILPCVPIHLLLTLKDQSK